MRTLTKLIAATAFAACAMMSSASAAVISGQLCGNKYIGLTQDGHELTPTLCQSGNSTGGPNSPIGQLGWTDSYEYNPQNGYSGSGSVELVVGQNTWSLTNPDGYGKLGVSIKQGNGFAFFELDLNKALSGMWATGNDPYPTGTGLSHMNAWYMGDPVNQIPVPASLPLLLGALGIGGFLARRKPAKA